MSVTPEGDQHDIAEDRVIDARLSLWWWTRLPGGIFAKFASKPDSDFPDYAIVLIRRSGQLREEALLRFVISNWMYVGYGLDMRMRGSSHVSVRTCWE